MWEGTLKDRGEGRSPEKTFARDLNDDSGHRTI